MSARKKCPHCGHENLERAVYCFQCGNLLQDDVHLEEPAGAPRRSQRAVKAIWQSELPSEPVPDSQSLPGTGFLHEIQAEEPLTCLYCGELNPPAAQVCARCGSPLIVPDRDSHLVAHASARTDVGRVRENNEDSVGLWAYKGVLLALVADGMGGAVAGEEASRLTVEAVQADFVGMDRSGFDLLTLAEEIIAEKLAAAIQAANLAVIDRVDEDAALRGMGTTATLAFVRGRRTLFAHVGDSRAYLVDGADGTIRQITSDHSFVEALLDAGHITEEQARDHPMKNVLYRALGQTPDTTADVYDRFLKDQDRIVLCSDGLTRHVTPDEIAQVVLSERNPEMATQRLIDLANERGGEDNVSAIVILMEEVSGTGPLAAARDTTESDDDDDTSPEIPLGWRSRLPPAESEDDRSRPSPLPTDPSDTEVTLGKPPSRRDQRLLDRASDEEDTIPIRKSLNKSFSRGGDDPKATEAPAELFPSPDAGEIGRHWPGDEDTVESIPIRGRYQALQMDAEDDMDDLEAANDDARDVSPRDASPRKGPG